MPDFELTKPVAFIVFNRPDTTARVFAEIAKAMPPKLLVVADGPRVGRAGEAERVAAARAAVVEQISWPCELLTNFSDENLGCKKRVSGGIDWIFQQVEEAIILEDDCLPDRSFFRFCEEMLDRYRNEQRVGMISGDNFQAGRQRGGDSYYFSKHMHVWGWASWRDRWQGLYDVAMRRWPGIRDDGRLSGMLPAGADAEYWRFTFERVYEGGIDTWDYQWVFTNWVEDRLCILPAENLVSNIGFGAEATHTTSENALANLPLRSLDFPLTHPLLLAANAEADRYSSDRLFRRATLAERITGRLRKMIRR